MASPGTGEKQQVTESHISLQPGKNWEFWELTGNVSEQGPNSSNRSDLSSIQGRANRLWAQNALVAQIPAFPFLSPGLRWVSTRLLASLDAPFCTNNDKCSGLVGWSYVLGTCKICTGRKTPFSVLFHSWLHSNLWQNQESAQKDLVAFVLPESVHRCMASADELVLTEDPSEALTDRRLLKHLFPSPIAASCTHYLQPSFNFFLFPNYFSQAGVHVASVDSNGFIFGRGVYPHRLQFVPIANVMACWLLIFIPISLTGKAPTHQLLSLFD